MFNSGSHSLKYYKRLKIYKNAHDTCNFNPETKAGRSYNWEFCQVVNGMVVFNSYHWSSTTSAHQSAVRSILRELKIDFIQVDMGRATPRGINLDQVKALYSKIVELEIECESSKVPESWANRYRLQTIKEGYADLEKIYKIHKRLKLTKIEMEAIRMQCYEKEMSRLMELESEKAFKALHLKLAAENVNEVQF